MGQNARAIRRRVGGNIQRLRLQRGFTQEKLAEMVGNSPKHIGLIERAQVNVGINTLAEIAAALSVDVIVLFVAPSRRRGGSGAARLLDEIDEATKALRASLHLLRRGE